MGPDVQVLAVTPQPSLIFGTDRPLDQIFHGVEVVIAVGISNAEEAKMTAGTSVTRSARGIMLPSQPGSTRSMMGGRPLDFKPSENAENAGKCQERPLAP